MGWTMEISRCRKRSLRSNASQLLVSNSKYQPNHSFNLIFLLRSLLSLPNMYAFDLFLFTPEARVLKWVRCATERHTCIVHVHAACAWAACHCIDTAVRRIRCIFLFTVCISGEVKIGARRILTWSKRNSRHRCTEYSRLVYPSTAPTRRACGESQSRSEKATQTKKSNVVGCGASFA